jgi:hypothetical protein
VIQERRKVKPSSRAASEGICVQQHRDDPERRVPNNHQEVHMLSTCPPRNLLEVADRLESEGRPHEAQQWRECAAEYDYLCSRRVRETLFDACFFGLSAVLSVLIFVVLIG